jgi:hypothetical protein
MPVFVDLFHFLEWLYSCKSISSKKTDYGTRVLLSGLSASHLTSALVTSSVT